MENGSRGVDKENIYGANVDGVGRRGRPRKGKDGAVEEIMEEGDLSF